MPPRRGSQSPPLMNLPLLIIILPTIALLALLIFACASSHFPPRTRGTTATSVRKSWDSLNVFLVLFAIICGVFARRNDDESSSTDEDSNISISSHAPASEMVDDIGERPVVPQWYSQLPEQNFYEDRETTSVRRLKRNSSSYPDLRQESQWETGDNQFRFFDDFEISKYRRPPASPVAGILYHVDTFAPNSPPQKSATPPPPPPPPPPSNRKPKRNYETIPRREKEIKEVPQPPPPPPPPPPPQPPRVAEESESERRKGRKKSNATKELKSVFTSLYNSQRKRKKKYKNRNSIQRDEPAYPQPKSEQPPFTRPSPSPPPPPPPPPPPSLFHSFFRKGSKNKRIHSLSAPPPPPPPPPPPTVSMPRRNERAPKPAPPRETSKRRSSSGSSWRPPLPTPVRASISVEEIYNFGNQSPMIPVPPPPPPPFKVPGFRFVVRGDYVKVRSASSSLCSSPERDEIEAESTNKVNPMSRGPVSCPSPDVNAKADTFIAMLRDGWRLEEKNSV